MFKTGQKAYLYFSLAVNAKFKSRRCCAGVFSINSVCVSRPERADWLDLWRSASGDDAPRRSRCPLHQETQTQESSVRTMLFSVLMLMSLMSSQRTVMSFSVCRLCVVLVSLPLAQAVQMLKYPQYHSSRFRRGYIHFIYIFSLLNI